MAKRIEVISSACWGLGRNRPLQGAGPGCIGREGTSEAAPEAVRQAVGGGCQSGWGRLLSVTNAIEAGTCCQGGSGWAQAGRAAVLRGTPPTSNASLVQGPQRGSQH